MVPPRFGSNTRGRHSSGWRPRSRSCGTRLHCILEEAPSGAVRSSEDRDEWRDPERVRKDPRECPGCCRRGEGRAPPPPRTRRGFALEWIGAGWRRELWPPRAAAFPRLRLFARESHHTHIALPLDPPRSRRGPRLRNNRQRARPRIRRLCNTPGHPGRGDLPLRHDDQHGVGVGFRRSALRDDDEHRRVLRVDVGGRWGHNVLAVHRDLRHAIADLARIGLLRHLRRE